MPAQVITIARNATDYGSDICTFRATVPLIRSADQPSSARQPEEALDTSSRWLLYHLNSLLPVHSASFVLDENGESQAVTVKLRDGWTWEQAEALVTDSLVSNLAGWSHAEVQIVNDAP